MRTQHGSPVKKGVDDSSVPVDSSGSRVRRSNQLAHGLILSFGPTDIPTLHADNRAIFEALKAIRCSVEGLGMGTASFKDDLEAFLQGEERTEVPRLIYVSGHGHEIDHDLYISSHDNEHPEKFVEVPWATIQAAVDAAECNVLVIVNCCLAGLAKLSSSERYAREVITATSWGGLSYYKFAPAMCRALPKWASQSTPHTASSLHRKLTDELESMRREAGKEKMRRIKGLKEKKGVIASQMQKRYKEKRHLMKWIKKLEGYNKHLTTREIKGLLKTCIGGSQVIKHNERFWKENEHQEEDMKHLESCLADAEAEREESMDWHPQPHFRRESSVPPAWKL